MNFLMVGYKLIINEYPWNIVISYLIACANIEIFSVTVAILNPLLFWSFLPPVNFFLRDQIC